MIFFSPHIFLAMAVLIPNTHLPTLHLHAPTRLAQRQPKMLIHPCFNLRIKHIAYQVLSTHLCLFLKSYSSLYLYWLSPSHPLLNDSAVCISAAELHHSKTSIWDIISMVREIWILDCIMMALPLLRHHRQGQICK